MNYGGRQAGSVPADPRFSEVRGNGHMADSERFSYGGQFDIRSPQQIAVEDMDPLPDINFNSEGGYPIQLIRYIRSQHQYEICEEAVQELMKYDGKIGFTCIAGAYRTGKSFLMNRVLNIDSGAGFKVDYKVNACTEGIWMWSKPVYNEKDDSLIFFIDTEGANSVERDRTHDAKVFSLALLISSYFIYNSVGNIDEQAISNLSMVAEISRHIAIKAGVPSDEYSLSAYAPKFLWVLRDFVLEIQDTAGRRISAPQYLEMSLTDPAIVNKGSESTKRIRSTLISFLRDRDCITLVRPLDDEEKLKNAERTSTRYLRPEFLRGLNQIREKILDKCTPKQLNGNFVTPINFIAMLESYIQSINSGDVPTISTAWDYILKTEAENAFKSAKETYTTGLKKKFEDNTAKSAAQLYFAMMEIRDDALEMFYRLASTRTDSNSYFFELRDKLKEYIAGKEAKALEINEKLNITNCEDVVRPCFDKVENKIRVGDYRDDNLETFSQDLVEGMHRYSERTSGEAKCDVLVRFMESSFGLMMANIIDDIRQSLKTKSNANEREMARNQEKENEYRSQIKTLQDQNRTLDERVRKADEEKQRIEAQMRKLAADNERLAADLKAQVDKMKSMPKVNQSKEDELKFELKEAQTNLEAMKRENAQLKAKLTKKKGFCGL
eukprot:TRINITY_DN2272_c0_g1_i3.p1 TRINITY_DN2272_c0_g1~~TRINITY_DN2272_c0_g1_i3.p1  ORF type:complete len:666 (+),score=194.62 TRINITY_DN2272_c0_g1_i3:115-2112(+)